MSASAFIATPDKIIALSDGLAVNAETLEPAEYHSSKVHKISDQTLITSAGRIVREKSGDRREIPEVVKDVAQSRGVVGPVGVSKIMIDALSGADDNLDTMNYHVMGFDGAGAMIRVHFTDSCRKGEVQPMGPNSIGIMAHDCEDMATQLFGKLVNEKYQGGISPDVARDLWEKTVRFFNSRGYLVGGEIFMETVVAPDSA